MLIIVLIIDEVITELQQGVAVLITEMVQIIVLHEVALIIGVAIRGEEIVVAPATRVIGRTGLQTVQVVQVIDQEAHLLALVVQVIGLVVHLPVQAVLVIGLAVHLLVQVALVIGRAVVPEDQEEALEDVNILTRILVYH